MNGGDLHDLRHAVLGTSLRPPYPKECSVIELGMGCFWGAERLLWRIPGVFTTAVAYCGGQTQDPGYKEVCTGQTGHAEVVRVVYMHDILPLAVLLRSFWEGHDPTQGMRQWNDIGTQYRSVINMWNLDQEAIVNASMERYQQRLSAAGMREITTERLFNAPSYLAETYHQQYLHHHPEGYCGLRGCGITFDP